MIISELATLCCYDERKNKLFSANRHNPFTFYGVIWFFSRESEEISTFEKVEIISFAKRIKDTTTIEEIIWELTV